MQASSSVTSANYTGALRRLILRFLTPSNSRQLHRSLTEHRATRRFAGQSRSCVRSTSPGVSGISAPMIKALCEDAESFNLVRDFVLEFWESEVVPSEWEKGLLKVLPKKGDLSDPGNHRGIMMLEVSYKVIAILLHMRLTPISERLEHESQCGFRPERGCADAMFSVKMAIDQEAKGARFGDVDLFHRLSQGVRQGTA